MLLKMMIQRMFTRAVIDRLDQWAQSEGRKPLIVRGARQVGKTVAVKMFGRRFERFIYLDMERRDQSEIFRRNLNVHDLFQAILLISKPQSLHGQILLFLDEIQNCPEAIESLRYFYEELPDIAVVAAGSLLEIALHEKNISFPVGRVSHHFMHPLTFREFLIADDLKTAIRAFDTIPLPAYAYEPLMRYFHKYALIGGMPEVVAAYLNENDLSVLTPIYDSLAVSYQDDVAKYARNPTMAEILRHCIESVPFSAGKRIVFAGFGQSNYRSREVGEALRTLQRAMLIKLIHPSTSVEIPVTPDMKKSPRLQLIDTGMLNYFVGLQEQYFLYDNLHAFYRGLLAEHIVGQELIAIETNSLKKRCFWVREKSQSMAEVDFIVQHKGHVIPVEVKSGKTGRLKSLHLFMDRCPHRFAVRLYAGPLEIHPAVTPKGKAFHLLNLPYFLASAIHRYIDWMIAEIEPGC